MPDASVKYKRGEFLRLSSLPIEDGSLIFTTDTKELYMDVGSSRCVFTNVKMVDSLPYENINMDIIYFLTTDNLFYRHDGTKWISTSDTQGTTMTGATELTDGTAGMVPTPLAGNQDNFLRGDGVWASPTLGREYLENISTPIADIVYERCMESILLSFYPVGSIYTSTEPNDPSKLFGGTWVRIKDTFLLAAGDEFTAGDTGGESSHTLTVNQMPIHSHVATTGSSGIHSHMIGGNKNTKTFSGNVWTIHENSTGAESFKGATSEDGSHEHTVTVENTGNGEAHNNMPPYLVVYVWQRVS